MIGNYIYWRKGKWFIPCSVFFFNDVCKSKNTKNYMCDRCAIYNQKDDGELDKGIKINVDRLILLINETELPET